MTPTDSDLILYRKKSTDSYRIRWIYEDGVEGVTLGADLPKPPLGALPEDTLLGDPDHRRVTRLLGNLPGALWDENGYFWLSLTQAETALQRARKAISKSALPLPYEAQALTAGWLPPAGWMPGKK